MSAQDGPPLTVEQYLELFEQGTKHLLAMAASLEVCWTPNESNPRRLHNLYARNLITCYVAKFAELSASIIDAAEKHEYLTYALCGRSLIEHTATLRYYALRKYAPLFNTGSADLKTLLEIDDQHLRGGKFDWGAFMTGDYRKLWNTAAEKSGVGRKRQGAKEGSERSNPSPVRIGECIKDWAAESPGIGVVYDLFCDMVHPNIGSTFLVASVGPNGLYFTKDRGKSIGRQVFEQSFPFLLSATQKPFGDFLVVLMGTIWQEDEL